MRQEAILTILEIPENVTFPDGVTVGRYDAEAHIKAAYGYPRVGYVLPAKGGSVTVYAAFVPNVERDESGEWERDGNSITWHKTFKSASKLVKAGYRALDKVENHDEEDWWIGENEADNDNEDDDDYASEAA